VKQACKQGGFWFLIGGVETPALTFIDIYSTLGPHPSRNTALSPPVLLQRLKVAMLIPNSIDIQRQDNGDYHIEWQTDPVNSAVTVALLDTSLPVQADYISGTRSGARLTGLPGGVRHVFTVSDQHGNHTIACERRIALAGSPNFRDFGGYHSANGQQVKWGHLFRSGQLADLNTDDINTVDQLQLDMVFDFRHGSEQASEQSRLPLERRPTVHSLPISPGDHGNFLQRLRVDNSNPEAAFELMVEINRNFAEGQTATYANMFKHILATDNARFLIHCAAGKDRTGFGAALILLALGVPKEVVLRDYMLTGKFFIPTSQAARLQEKYQTGIAEHAILPVLEVHEAYLLAAISTMEQQFSSVDNYLHEALRLGPAELQELRARYLA
jgi:protein-tyrosine phosphatase